jgi:hypothetical protein
MEPRIGSNSPWDKIDHLTKIADGVIFVSTPGHGGFWISSERVQEIKKHIPALMLPSNCYPVHHAQRGSFDTNQWFEEDSEAYRVVLGLPHLFKVEQVDAAILAARQQGAMGWKPWDEISQALSDLSDEFVRGRGSFSPSEVAEYLRTEQN